MVEHNEITVIKHIEVNMPQRLSVYESLGITHDRKINLT